MKLLFSEYKSDYSNYIFPYAIWAIPEKGETPAMIFDSGFLPASREFKRFYMCRHLRIRLKEFTPSSENRRIFRKGDGVSFELVPREEFEFTDKWQEFCRHYADIKFGKDVMTTERLNSLFHSPIVSHLLIYKDSETQKNIGLTTLYLEEKKLAYYYYAFYDLNYYERNLGMYMMTSAVDLFAEKKFKFIYLGSCYSRNALYKTQFSGAEFFTGFRWSGDLTELKYLIKRDKGSVSQHLLETDDFLHLFYDDSLDNVVQSSAYELHPNGK